MPFIRLRDGRRLWLEEWQIDMIAAEPPNLHKWLREDAAAFAAQRRGLPPSANVRPAGAPVVITVNEPEVKPSGWSEPLPLRSPPGTELVDRIVDAQDRKDRAEREAPFRRKLK
jgi:hypothetical protein